MVLSPVLALVKLSRHVLLAVVPPVPTDPKTSEGRKQKNLARRLALASSISNSPGEACSLRLGVEVVASGAERVDHKALKLESAMHHQYSKCNAPENRANSKHARGGRSSSHGRTPSL